MITNAPATTYSIKFIYVLLSRPHKAPLSPGFGMFFWMLKIVGLVSVLTTLMTAYTWNYFKSPECVRVCACSSLL